MSMMEKFQSQIEKVLVPIASKFTKTCLCGKRCIYIIIPTNNGGFFNGIT